MPEEVAGRFTAADVFALPTPAETREERVFEGAGRSWLVRIRTDGAARAERWAVLYGAFMHGQVQQQAAKFAGKAYSEVVMLPDGTRVVVTNPSYIGAVKLLSEVIEEPALSFNELLIFGHKVGKVIDEITDWAAMANGVTGHVMSQMQDLSKNLCGAEDGSDGSDAPV